LTRTKEALTADGSFYFDSAGGQHEFIGGSEKVAVAAEIAGNGGFAAFWMWRKTERGWYNISLYLNIFALLFL